MRYSFERNFGITSDTKIKCDGTFKNIRQILLGNGINYTDFEETDLQKKVKLNKELHVELTRSKFLVDELYYTGYTEFKSVVFDNGVQIKLSLFQPFLVTTHDYNKYCTINNFRRDEDALLFVENSFKTARILSSTTIGLEPTWTPFRYNNKNFITEQGLILS